MKSAKNLPKSEVNRSTYHWATYTSLEATWEFKENMKAKYPHLFDVFLYFIKNHKFRGPNFLKREGCNKPPLHHI